MLLSSIFIIKVGGCGKGSSGGGSCGGGGSKMEMHTKLNYVHTQRICAAIALYYADTDLCNVMKQTSVNLY